MRLASCFWSTFFLVAYTQTPEQFIRLEKIGFAFRCKMSRRGEGGGRRHHPVAIRQLHQVISVRVQTEDNFSLGLKSVYSADSLTAAGGMSVFFLCVFQRGSGGLCSVRVAVEVPGGCY